MAPVFNLILAFCLFTLMEKSQSKELKSEDDDDLFMNLFDDEELQGVNERYARHVQAITENALDHIVSEIKHEYFKNNYFLNSPLRKYIRKLNQELTKKNHNEVMKNKQDKKVTNKKKTLKKKKRVKKNKKTPNNKGKKYNGKVTDKKKTPSV